MGATDHFVRQTPGWVVVDQRWPAAGAIAAPDTIGFT